MTAEKKTHAANGNKLFQHEWMREEVNEFYEAIDLEDLDEIHDEAIGLIRTFQQFQGSKRVVYKVRKDVIDVFPTHRIFLETFGKWHAKSNQAHGVTPEETNSNGNNRLTHE